jgi:hypothetical protein
MVCDILKIETAMFRINANPVKSQEGCHLAHRSGLQRDPKPKGGLTTAQLVLESLTCG